ncbi:hypothetical protein Q0812_08675 [Brevundimonas sp. 2R-24]|uniref:YXWGXW repeat-containing protein n=1 Tax=Peiella sedimenti TaxID=3061083 RepID=A0ABT8SLR4_9CAUL|nr:hypothetical protein [Caulobacteraceae bacterium XZ-24]
MNRRHFALTLVALTSSASVAGCSHGYGPGYGPWGGTVIYVRTAPPPPPPRIIIPPRPSSTAVWIEGYWNWTGVTFVWVDGFWERSPPPGRVWAPGRWVQTPRGWRHEPGRWVARRRPR